MKLILILRGVAGSGKSTEAQRWLGRATAGIIVSADDYMGIEFNFEKLEWCHQMCRSAFRDAIGARRDLIVVDNTNTKVSDMRVYVEIGRQAGYEVLILQINVDPRLGASRTLHNVPLETVERQGRRLWAERLPVDWEVWQKGRPWRPPEPDRRVRGPAKALPPPRPVRNSPTVEYKRIRVSSESS